MKTTDHSRDFPCPLCKRTLSASTNPYGNDSPSKGALTICLYCAAVLVFDSETTVHAITQAEELALPDDVREKLSTIQAAIKSLKRQKGEATA